MLVHGIDAFRKAKFLSVGCGSLRVARTSRLCERASSLCLKGSWHRSDSGKPPPQATQMLLPQCCPQKVPNRERCLLPFLPGPFLTIPGTETSSPPNSTPGRLSLSPCPLDIAMDFCDSSVSCHILLPQTSHPGFSCCRC